MSTGEKTASIEDRKKYQAYKNSGALERVADAVTMLIQQEDDFVVSENWRRHYLSFAPEEWRIDKHPARTLRFVFNSTPGNLCVQLIIFNPEPEDGGDADSLRQAWLEYALAHRPPFTPSDQTLNRGNTTIYTFKLLGPYPPGITDEEIEEELQRNWESFKARDYPELMHTIAQFTE
jgi:hypothetical protein